MLGQAPRITPLQSREAIAAARKHAHQAQIAEEA